MTPSEWAENNLALTLTFNVTQLQWLMKYSKHGIPLFKISEWLILYIEIRVADRMGIPKEAWAKVPPDKRLTILKWQAALN